MITRPQRRPGGATIQKYYRDAAPPVGKRPVVQPPQPGTRQSAVEFQLTIPKSAGGSCLFVPPHVRKFLEQTHHEACLQVVAYLLESTKSPRRSQGTWIM